MTHIVFNHVSSRHKKYELASLEKSEARSHRLKYAPWLVKKDAENELGNTGHTTTAAVGSVAEYQQLKGLHSRVEAERGLGRFGIDEFLNALNSTVMEGGTE